MLYQTTRFGPITLSDDKVIHFPLGLLGFERFQRYALIDSDEAAPLRWLQCLDEPSLAFLVVEPALFFPDYAFKLPGEDVSMLSLDPDTEPVVACLVVVPEDPRLMTINLMGPLVVNPEKRVGKQVVLHDEKFSAKQPLLPDSASSETPALV